MTRYWHLHHLGQFLSNDDACTFISTSHVTICVLKMLLPSFSQYLTCSCSLQHSMMTSTSDTHISLSNYTFCNLLFFMYIYLFSLLAKEMNKKKIDKYSNTYSHDKNSYL